MTEIDTTRCPRCGTATAEVPGIGPACLNRACDAADDLRPDWKERGPTEAEMFFRRLRNIAKRDGKR